MSAVEMRGLLVESVSGELYVSSETIAERTEVGHRAVLQLIRSSVAEFEQFGDLAFEMRDRPGVPGPAFQVALLNEPQSTLLMTYMRNSEIVKEFKLELVKQFYAMRQALVKPAELSRRDLALMIVEAEDALAAAESRAVVAEGFREAIELNAGLTPREFLKKYLPDLRETDFNNILYRTGLLLDQRAQRQDGKGGWKEGRQHRHPGFAGKPFFYLHSQVDSEGVRRERVRVRPGQPELDLAAWFAARKHKVNGAAA